jgi:hypothetical protein
MLLELPDIEVRDNPLVEGRIVTYTSKVRLVTDISAATQKESNFNPSKITIHSKPTNLNLRLRLITTF